MAISVEKQAMSLLCFLCAGFVLGLVYDLIRPARYAGRAGWIWDGLFCFAAGAAGFVLSSSRGSMGLWDLAAMALGLCLYINLLSPIFLPYLLRLHGVFVRLTDSVGKTGEEVWMRYKKTVKNSK